jgi:hypothetical protein
VTTEPGWEPPTSACPGCFAYVAPGATDITSLTDAGRPNNANLCVGQPANGAWVQLPCDLNRAMIAVICEREPVGASSRPCNNGVCIHIRATLGTKHYVYFPDQVTARAAASACLDLGARLVVFTSVEEREEITREVVRYVTLPAPTYWINLARAADGTPGGQWLWGGGSVEAGENGPYPDPWGEGEPVANGDDFAYAYLPQGATDLGLAHNNADNASDPSQDVRAYVCEFLETDGGTSGDP